jgi:hypothetical protein
MRTCTCPICGSVFATGHSRQRYCSKRCAHTADLRRRSMKRRKEAPAPPVELTCRHCGQTFTKPAIASGSRYCSITCRSKAEYRRRRPEPEPTTSTCEHCGQTFSYVRRTKPRRYCSRRCATRAYKARQQQEPPEDARASEADGRERTICTFPQGSFVGPADVDTGDGRDTFCALCGRPDTGDLGQWRVRPVRYSPRSYTSLKTICPDHYAEGEIVPGWRRWD